MRLTWLSNAPWTPTGYGQQTALYGTRLVKAKHDIAVIANYGHHGEALNWNGMHVFGASFHPFAMDIIHGHSNTFQADALLTLMDVQVMELDALLGTKWIAWFPTDHLTIPPVIFDKLTHADARISMSKHGKAELDKSGVEGYYIPCGVDTKVFCPRDMQASRAEMFLPADKFIVGMVAMNKGNPSRKSFQQTITAFAALQKKHGDCLLYLHTTDGVRGVEPENLLSLCKALGLRVGYAFQPDNDFSKIDVLFADQYGLSGGYTPDMMAKLYSCMDAHCLVTRGEGFGIPVLEAQACGTPVIVGDWTATSELCFSGWKIDPKEADPLFTQLDAYQIVPRVGPIAERLDAAYTMRGNNDYRKRAEKGAQAYDADKVIEKYWLPTLQQIQDNLQSYSVNKAEALVGALRV